MPTRPAPPPFAGNLADLPVPRQLLAHFRTGTTGALRIERGKVFKEILLHNGIPIGSRSNIRSEALGSMLVARGVITESQLNYLLGEMKARGSKMGETLIELGWLTPEDVLAFFAAQNKWRVVEALRWREGTFTFNEDTSFLKDVIEHALDIPGAVFWGLKKTAEPARIAEALLAKHGDARAHLNPDFAVYEASFAEHFGTQVTLALRDSPTVRTLLDGSAASNAAVALDALLLCGLAQLEVLTAQPVVPTTLASSRADTLAELRDQMARQAADVPDTPFDFESAPNSWEPEHAAPTREFDESSDSGVISIEALSALRLQETERAVEHSTEKSTPAPPRGQPLIQSATANPSDLILREYLRIHGKDLYEVLAVTPTATSAQILAAYEARRRELPHPSNDAALSERVQEIQFCYAHAFGVLSDAKLRRAYDEELSQRHKHANLLDAELAYKEGRRLFKDGALKDAAAQFERAATTAPDQAQYRAWLAWSRYRLVGKSSADDTRAALLWATQMDPDCVDAHAFLGTLAHEQGDGEVARTSLERVLALEPTRLDALATLENLLAESGEFHVIEQLYRRLIQAVDPRQSAIVVTLWKNLGRLYENEFEDLPAARTAYEVAARLAPEDADLHQKVILLGAAELGRWKELAHAMASEWRLKPEDSTRGTALFNLYRRVGKRDGASIVAAAMVLRNAATAVHREIAQRHRPKRLQRLQQALDANTWASVRHPDEHPLIEELFAELIGAGILQLQAPAAGSAPITRERLPTVFANVLDYACQAVLPTGTRVEVALSDQLEGEHAIVTAIRPTRLTIADGLLASTQPIEIACALGHALSFATPGRIVGASLTGRHLRPYLVACMAHGLKTVSSSEPEVLSVLDRIAVCPETTRERLAVLGARIARERKTLNLSRWARSLRHTALRIALLLSRDLQATVRLATLLGDNEMRDALIDFAVSPEHLELRAALGVITATPPPLPASITNRREAERIDLEIEINLESENNLYTGILQDISSGGVFVATHSLRPVGEKLNIELRLPGTPGPVFAKTEVSWVRKEGNGDTASAQGMGLRFLNPNPELLAACTRFLEQRESLFYDTE